MTDEDLPFVISSWLRSHPGDATRHRPLVILLLASATVRLVAVDPEDPSHIMGWIVGGLTGTEHGETPVIHYSFVKFAFREMGVFTALLEDALARLGVKASDTRKGCSSKLVHSFCGKSTRDDSLTHTAFEVVRSKYNTLYDPHALFYVPKEKTE